MTRPDEIAALADELDKRVKFLADRSRVGDAILMQRAAKALRLSATSPGDAVREAYCRGVRDADLLVGNLWVDLFNKDMVKASGADFFDKWRERIRALAPAEKAGDELPKRPFAFAVKRAPENGADQWRLFMDEGEAREEAAQLDGDYEGLYRVGDRRSVISTPTPPSADVAKWTCMGRRQSLPEPGECDWPNCGCDPHATKVIESLLEQDWRAPPAPLPWDAFANRSHEPTETRAKEIYDAFEHDGVGTKPAWVDGGNGIKQDEARMIARREIRARQSAAHGGGTESDGGVEGHARSATKAETAPQQPASGTDRIEAPVAGIKPGPSDPAQAPEALAFTNAAQLGFLKDPAYAEIPMAMWAKRSESYGDIPLYTRPVSLDREAVKAALIRKRDELMERTELLSEDEITNELADAILALIEGRT